MTSSTDNMPPVISVTGDVTAERYVIRGGAEGKKRLRVIADVLSESARALFERIALPRGARCVDVGCGGGDIALEIARIVGADGHVVGIDMDAEKLELARADAAQAGLQNIEFRVGDAREFDDRGAYDCAFARFLLTHLSEPGDLVARMVRAVRAGGRVILEDIDYSGIVCYPPNSAIQRHIELYRELVRRRGGDADIGPRLPSLIGAAGVEGVHVRVVQPCFLEGQGKFIYSITTESIAEALEAERLVDATEVAELIAELNAFAADSTTLLTFPRIVQAWGTVSAGGDRSE